MYLSPQQVVSEPMVVCGEGGDVFIVPIQWGQRKGILLMVLNKGVVRDSHGYRRAGFPWMCV